MIALLVAAIEILGCLQQEQGYSGGFWDIIALINAHFEYLGYGIIGFFALSSIVSVLLFRCWLDPANIR